jgi:hypothetical protein
VGLLHKLAELVVEFPEDRQKLPGGKPPAGKQAGAGGQDVVAAIEELTKQLEGSAKTDFEGAPPLKGSAPSAAIAAKAGAGASPAASAPLQSVAADSGAGIKMPVILDIDQVYDRAQIKPGPDGFDLNKIEQMLNHPDIANLPIDIRARSVKMALQSMGRDLRAVLEDAARRDKALDDYLVYLEHRVQQVEEQVGTANEGLKREIEDFVQAKNAVIGQNRALADQARQAVDSFRHAKQGEEQRLFNIVAPFVSPGENPVVISGDADSAPRPEFKGGEKK